MSFDDLIKPEKEKKPEPKPEQPKKLEIPNVFLGQVKLKPVPQKAATKKDEPVNVSKILSKSK